MTDQISVLYVDDEPDLLDLGKIFLERTGDFRVTIATGVKRPFQPWRAVSLRPSSPTTRCREWMGLGFKTPAFTWQ